MAALREILPNAGRGVAGAERRCDAKQGGKGESEAKWFGHPVVLLVSIPTGLVAGCSMVDS